MNTDQSERIAELADRAFDRLARERLAPTPQNYFLWFTYYSGCMPDLNRAIDLMQQLGQAFTPQRVDDLCRRFLGLDGEAHTVRRTGERTRSLLDGLVDPLGTSLQMTRGYGDTLAVIDHRLAPPPPSPGELRALIGETIAATEGVVAEWLAVRARLDTALRDLSEIAREIEVARREARVDELTGLANRRVFDERIGVAVHAASAGAPAGDRPAPLSVLVLALDGLDRLDGLDGRPTADHALRLVGRVVLRNVKKRDQPARFSGYELAVLLPQTSLPDAATVAEQIRQDAAAQKIIARGSATPVSRLEVSIGVAGLAPGEAPSDLVRRALAALARAQAAGGNRVYRALGRPALD